jgi:hypothetical protein
LAELNALKVSKDAPYTFSVICPSLVIGPALQAESIDKLNSSVSVIYEYFHRDGSASQKLPEDAGAFVEVRDTAEALFQAVVQNKGGRYLVSSGVRSCRNEALIALGTETSWLNSNRSTILNVSPIVFETTFPNCVRGPLPERPDIIWIRLKSTRLTDRKSPNNSA